MGFREIDKNEVLFDPFRTYRDKWPLLTAGIPGDFNTMTISWGSFGELWSRPTATVYVRHSRYTYEFVEREEYFTLSFFASGARENLSRLGTLSGRDIDKINASGFTPCAVGDSVAFEEAEMVVLCRKLYRHDIVAQEFTDAGIDKTIYKNHGSDYHRAYIAEILKVYVKG